jgi:hypothetical protein
VVPGKLLYGHIKEPRYGVESGLPQAPGYLVLQLRVLPAQHILTIQQIKNEDKDDFGAPILSYHPGNFQSVEDPNPNIKIFRIKKNYTFIDAFVYIRLQFRIKTTLGTSTTLKNTSTGSYQYTE